MTWFETFWENNSLIVKSFAFSLLILAAFWIAATVFYRKIAPAIIANRHGKIPPVLVLLVEGFKRPGAVYLRVLGVAYALRMLALWLVSADSRVLLSTFLSKLADASLTTIRISTVIFIAWGLISSSDVSSLLFKNAQHKLDLNMSKSVSKFLAAVINVVVFAFATVIILSELNYDVNGLIAGLGLGGLTIALAAKDSASNFFGGLVLITEKPFEIGDWIVCNEVEGTVEDINLRSTKVRTISGSLTVVPNSFLASAPITNWSGVMEKRRADFTLQLVYGTQQEQLNQFTNDIRQILETDEDIVKDSIQVRFSDFGESGLHVRIIFYTALPGFADHVRIEERINYAIMELAHQQHIKFAFPSRSVYLATPEQAKEA